MNLEDVLKKLNPEQKQAVETIDGPVLVIAGPGTGKTQLLSARVANILQKTDAAPENILCLTFTEAGASNMRDRLNKFIGPASYHININTYHGFGSQIIAESNDYLTTRIFNSAVDELWQHKIITSIQKELPYGNILKNAKASDIISTISEVKRALLTPEALRIIVKHNRQMAETINKKVQSAFAPFANRSPGTFAKAKVLYSQIMVALKKAADDKASTSELQKYEIQPAAKVFLDSLKKAYLKAEEMERSTELTRWKTENLEKDLGNNFILKIESANKKMESLADILEKYSAQLAEQGLYDYDDMIALSAEVLAANDDLRYTLQEKYQYILLDEFQDTNPAQDKIVELLTNNPASEGRPNVLAVGDDDQAIYAFQGAVSSNLLDFYKRYRDVKIINLTKNYRSASDILAFASNIINQVSDRFSDSFDDIEKTLTAENEPAEPSITRIDLLTPAAENDWVAEKIAALIKSGEDPREIAVMAPKHKFLEALLPFLHRARVAVSYEKRENILESKPVLDLLALARLLHALANGQNADIFWPEVLSLDVFNINPTDIWRVSWGSHLKKQSWAEYATENGSASIQTAARFILDLALKTNQESLESMLDKIINSEPFKKHYLEQPAGELYLTLSHLSVLREKLHDYKRNNHTESDSHESANLHIGDLVDYATSCSLAGIKAIDTSPYKESGASINLLTAYGAKGLEFKHVFLLSVNDATWNKAKNQVNKINLPANLRQVRTVGDKREDKLRLLFVAITRAKSNLYLSSSTDDFSGKKTSRLEFLDERETEETPGTITFRSFMLPDKYADIMQKDAVVTDNNTALLEPTWFDKHLPESPPMQTLLAERLQTYVINASHVNSFLDVRYGGPLAFYQNTILRFPSEDSSAGIYGDAIHAALDHHQKAFARTGSAPEIATTIQVFRERIERSRLSPAEIQLLVQRGAQALPAFLSSKAQVLTSGLFQSEINFHANEVAVLTNNILLGGKIDRIEINKQAKTITIVDFKTGKPHAKWSKSDATLHKYQTQLYIYRLLLERSSKFRGYKANSARLEFIDPDENGQLSPGLTIDFDSKEQARIEQLIALQRRITAERIAAYVGGVQSVLVEEKSKRDQAKVAGKTPQGITVNFPGGPELIGRIVSVRIDSAAETTLRGTMVE